MQHGFPQDPRQHGPRQELGQPVMHATERMEQAFWSPETERVWALRSIFATIRLIFGEVTPGIIVSIKHEIERGRLTRMADLHSRMVTTDAVVNVAYRIRRGAVAGRPVRVTPAKLDPVRDAGRIALAEQAANLGNMIVQGTPDRELVAMKQLGAIGDGIAVAETVWKRQRGTWMPSHVGVQTREVWLDSDWTPMVRDPSFVFHRCADHPGKFWIHEPSVQPGPFGDQVGFAAAIWPWLFKVWATKFWMTASERYGTPIAIGKFDPNAQIGTDTQTAESAKSALLADLKQLTTDSVAVTSAGSDIDIKPAMAGASSALFKELIDWLDRQIMLAILGSPDLLVAGQNGSRAAVQTRDGLRLETSASDARFLWGSYQRDVLTWALRYNGLGDAPVPEVETIFSDDIPAIAATDCAVPAFSIDDVRASHGLPEWGPDKGGDKVASSAVVAAQTPGMAGIEAKTTDVQATALNGAQVQSLQGILTSVATGQLPRASGVELLVAAFPLTRDEAERIMGQLGAGFVPAAPQPSISEKIAPGEGGVPPGDPTEQAPGGAPAAAPFTGPSRGGMPDLSLWPARSR